MLHACGIKYSSNTAQALAYGLRLMRAPGAGADVCSINDTSAHMLLPFYYWILFLIVRYLGWHCLCTCRRLHKECRGPELASRQRGRDPHPYSNLDVYSLGYL
jgi:hypothetical protein